MLTYLFLFGCFCGLFISLIFINNQKSAEKKRKWTYATLIPLSLIILVGTILLYRKQRFQNLIHHYKFLADWAKHEPKCMSNRQWCMQQRLKNCHLQSNKSPCGQMLLNQCTKFMKQKNAATYKQFQDFHATKPQSEVLNLI